jgi:hypothetical protein
VSKRGDDPKDRAPIEHAPKGIRTFDELSGHATHEIWLARRKLLDLIHWLEWRTGASGSLNDVAPVLQTDLYGRMREGFREAAKGENG